MMRVYHFSNKLLHSGYVFQSKSSAGYHDFWGKHFGEYGYNVAFTPFAVSGVPWDRFRELFFEWVREKEYPNRPSRLSCLFGVPNQSDVELWKSRKSLCGDHLYAVQSEITFVCDAGWLDAVSNNFASWISATRSYWAGEMRSKDSLPEVLLSLPTVVLEQVY